MSSSNQVRLTYIEEATLGTTPGTGNFVTVRAVSDSLSGSPDTTESQQIRTDRLSSGQIVTGLTLGGEISYELSVEPPMNDFFRAAMFQDAWTTDTPVSVDLTVAVTGGTITRSSGDWTSDCVVGDILEFTGFTNSVNNTSQVMIASIDSATVISYIGPTGTAALVNEVATGTTYAIADKVTVGTTQQSFSIEKAFLDLTNKAIIYKGIVVSSLSLDVAHGSIVNGSVGFSGTDYSTVDAAADFITYTRTINAAATTDSMNGSVDMPFIANSATGTFGNSSFCIQSVNISLNNNLTPKNCIGSIAPGDYTEGQAQIEVSITAYLADGTWDMLAAKLTQSTFAVGFQIKNDDGYYGFYMPAVQVTMDDPAGVGLNQDVIITMTGVAKVGANGESSLTIFKG